MKTSILSVACLAITLGLALADYSSYGSYGSYGGGYGGYGGGYGLGYALPYAPPQGGAVGGIGQGGLLMLIGLLFIFTLLLNSSIFNFTSSSTSTSTPITLLGR